MSKHNIRPIIWYSAFFAFLICAVFQPFFAQNRSLLWDPDAVVYHIPMAEVFAESVKHFLMTGTFAGYDLSIGMGTDVLQYIAQWYMEPLNLLYAFSGPETAETIYGGLIIVRLYLVGISFLLFSDMISENVMAKVMGALVYVFSGYTLFTGTKAAPFLVAMILFPLILLAAEKVRVGKGMALFMLLIAFSAIFSYYFLFMNSVLMALYVLIKVFAEREKVRDAIRYIARLLAYYLTGLAIAGVVFLPSVVGFFGSSRSDGARNVSSILHYNAEYYKTLLTGLLYPQAVHDYWLVIGFTPLIVVAVGILFFQKDRVALRLKAAWIILLAGVCMPLFGCLMNGGKVANNRWLYALVFVGGLTVCKTYTAVTYHLSRIKGAFVWCAVLMISLSVGGNLLFSDGFINEFHEAGSGYKTMSNNACLMAAKIEDESLYRVDNTKTPKTASSAWIIKDYRGLVTNASGYSKEMADFYFFFENAGMLTNFRLAGMDNSTVLTTLAGVKYYTAVRGEENRVPYGYEYVKDGIYKNKNAVPFSYSYDSFVLQSEVADMSPAQKQEVLLQAAIVEDEVESIEKKESETLLLGAKELDYEIVNAEKVAFSEDGKRIQAKKKKAGFDIVIRDIPGAGEIYIEWKGIEIRTKKVETAAIGFTENGAQVSSLSLQQKGMAYASGNDTFAVNVGYADTDDRTIHVYFTQKAKYDVDDIRVYYLPLNSYEERLSQMTQDVFEITEWSDTEIVGKVSVKEKKLLCLPLIYSKGWHVFADGKEQTLVKVNLMYSGVVIDESMKELRFEYETPYLKAGMFLSLIGLLIFIGLIVWSKRKKHIC